MPQPTVEGFKIPNPIDPGTRLCFKMKIPDSVDHISALNGALSALGFWYNWKKTGDDKGSQAAQVWKKLLYESVICDDCFEGAIFDLRQAGILIERQDTSGGGWSTLYDPRPYVLLKTPTAIHHNTVSAAPGVAGLNLLSVVGERDNPDDSILYVVAGWNAPAAIFRRNDALNGETVRIEHNLTGGVGDVDFLRAMDTTGSRLSGINPFGNIVLRRYSVALPTASAAHYGSLAMLGNGSTDNALWYCDYNSALAEYYWRKGVGSPGPAGTPGTPGHGVGVLDPALQEVLNPNQPPEMVIDDALPSITYVGWKLPRAAAISLLPTTYSPPGSPITVAMSSDTNGDKLVQFDFPEIPEPSGEDSLYDYTLPALGATKTYKRLVLADSGTIFGMVIPVGVTIVSITAVGQWNVVMPDIFAVPQVVTDKDGVPPSFPFTINDGKLMYGIQQAGTTASWAYFPYDELPLETELPINLKLAQNRNALSMLGEGYLIASITLARGNYTWEIRLDFTENEYAECVFDQDSSVHWVSGEGYVTDSTLWYARLSMGLIVTSASTLTTIITEQESVFSSPGVGWNNLDKCRVDVNGTIVDYNEAFDYPVSTKIRNVDRALAISPLGNTVQIGADTQAATGVTGVLTVKSCIFRGTGERPTMYGCDV